METQTKPNKPGPKKKEGRSQYTMLIDDELAQWAKGQPTGLSGKVRELLEADRRKLERATK